MAVKVGDTALGLSARFPERVLYDAKRVIGKELDDPKIEERKGFWPFKMTKHKRSGKP